MAPLSKNVSPAVLELTGTVPLPQLRLSLQFPLAVPVQAYWAQLTELAPQTTVAATATARRLDRLRMNRPTPPRTLKCALEITARFLSRPRLTNSSGTDALRSVPAETLNRGVILPKNGEG